MDFVEQKEIENANIIIDHFGYWPTFHDSEVISIKLERTLDKEHSSVQLRLYSFEMTSELINGYYKLIKHCFIDFEFLELNKVELDGFNHQNAVLALEFGREEKNKFCNIINAYGVDGYVEANQIRIKNLEPILEKNVVKG